MKAGLGEGGTGGPGEGPICHSPSLPVSQSPSRSLAAIAILTALLSIVANAAAAQQLSDLEPDRPVTLEDARPVSYRAFSAAADWTYNVRKDSRDDYGPGFSLLYGAARNLEVGGSVRYVTSPGSNAQRGISSGDIQLHTLYGIATERPSFPALAVRVGVGFPTGLDSKGTDLHVALLATQSFDVLRIHVNGIWTHLGDTGTSERRERWEGVAGADWVVGRHGTTDTLLVVDTDVRSNPVLGGTLIVTVEAGARQRIGSQTFVFFGAGSAVTGEKDRATVRLRAGISHIF
jgi:hypothetical protein